MERIIELRDVEKSYQLDEVKTTVLKNINLKIERGDVMAIIGPSGCGKSTLLHLMGCLDRPTKGNIMVDDADVTKLDDGQLAKIRRNKIGFVFQFFYLIPTLTALKNVMLPMSFTGASTEQQKRRAMQLLKLVGLEKRASHRPSQLSGGERQRVAIARALANEPKIILADEPTGNLDSKTGKQIINLLLNLNKKEGVTIILVTHDPYIASHAEKTIYLKDGKIEKVEAK